jgi:hypothetical protein
MNEGGKSTKKASEQRRLSAALRENLRRRKTQARGRSAAEDKEPKPHRSARFDDDNETES